MELSIALKDKRIILALGAESAGNFSVFKDGKIYFSQDFGDLLEEKSWLSYKKAALDYLRKNNLKPDVIISDLHPLFNTTKLGKDLTKKYKADFIQVQHHKAHIFSAIGDKLLQYPKYKIPKVFYGIAMDGTGYSENEDIWGGEIFKVSKSNFKRIGHLENQILIGGELAIRQPARFLIAILSKFLKKEEFYPFIKKYYSKNEFELFNNQLEQKFNCLETSSTGRILDAVSLLLGFCKNERKYKHEPIDLLEKNSTNPYTLKPVIENNILLTTPLFEYLVKNLNKDKERLAATAQLYIAKGLLEIINNCHPELVSGSKNKKIPNQVRHDIFISGGIANNKIISDYLISKSAYAAKKIPRGDAGISFGQVIYFLLSK